MEHVAVGRVWDTDKFGSDGRCEGRTIVSLENLVYGPSYNFFGIDQEAVHVEDAGAHRRCAEADCARGEQCFKFTTGTVHAAVTHSVIVRDIVAQTCQVGEPKRKGRLLGQIMR